MCIHEAVPARDRAVYPGGTTRAPRPNHISLKRKLYYNIFLGFFRGHAPNSVSTSAGLFVSAISERAPVIRPGLSRRPGAVRLSLYSRKFTTYNLDTPQP